MVNQNRIGYSVSYEHVSGETRLIGVHSSTVLAKANYLNKFFVKIDGSWTPSKVEEAWNSWIKFHDARVVEIFTSK